MTPLHVGRKEYVLFPEWDLRLRAKVDTGAFSSALDAAAYELFERDGVTIARIRLVPNRKRSQRFHVVETPVLRFTRVTCTSGACEQRPVVSALLRLGAVEKHIRLTLTNRAGLRHRMLLGREALRGTFLVDVSQKYLLGR